MLKSGNPAIIEKYLLSKTLKKLLHKLFFFQIDLQNMNFQLDEFTKQQQILIVTIFVLKICFSLEFLGEKQIYKVRL